MLNRLVAEFGVTWAMDPPAYAALAGLTKGNGSQGLALNQAQQTVVGRVTVARIPIKGVMLPHAPDWLADFGIQACDVTRTRAAVEAAVKDKAIQEIMLDIDSPGGVVTGVPELAETIRLARETKPVTAVVGGRACSAAYWASAQASCIVASRSSEIGSIGVYQVVVDGSMGAASEGVTVHVIASGPHKGLGVPGAAVTDEQLAEVRRSVDSLAAMFVGDVAEGRDTTPDAIEPLASGRTWVGHDAVSCGLADVVTILSSEAVYSAVACGEPLEGERMFGKSKEVETQPDPRVRQLEAELSVAMGTIDQLRAKVAELSAQARAGLMTKYADRISPAAASAVSALGEACGEDIGKFEALLTALPQVTRPTRHSSVDAAPGSEGCSSQALEIAKQLGNTAEELNKFGK